MILIYLFVLIFQKRHQTLAVSLFLLVPLFLICDWFSINGVKDFLFLLAVSISVHNMLKYGAKISSEWEGGVSSSLTRFWSQLPAKIPLELKQRNRKNIYTRKEQRKWGKEMRAIYKHWENVEYKWLTDLGDRRNLSTSNEEKQEE